MFKHKPHPDQLLLELKQDSALERMIEARVAVRAEADALRWRLRLILVETVIIAVLVLAAGLVLGQPAAIVLRSALVVGAGCFLSGAMLIALTGAAVHLLARLRCWRRR